MNEFRIRLRLQHVKYQGDYRYFAITAFNREIISRLEQYSSLDLEDKDHMILPPGYYLEEFLERIE